MNTTDETSPQGRDIMRRRAEALARPLEKEQQDRELFMVVEFLLAGEHYALDVDQVLEVAPIQELVPLPGTPDFVMGIINLRGEIRSVVDLRRVFEIPGQRPSDKGQVVILDNGDMVFGLYAEEVVGARALYPEALSDSLPTLTDIRAEFLKGVTDQGLVYLDAHRLLSDPRLTLNHDAT